MCVQQGYDVMQEWGIQDGQVAGLGSDGASVMFGIHTSVGVRLKQCQPSLVHVHCIAHRVALAAKDATEGVLTISDYRLCLQQIFKLYRASVDRTHRLKELCDALGETDYHCLKHPISVRWLSLGLAVRAIRNVYYGLVLELEEEAQRKNASAAGLLVKSKTYTFIATTYLLSDVIPLIEKLRIL